MSEPQGNEAPQASQGTNEPKQSFDNEQFNKAFTARAAAFEKQITARLEKQFSEFGASLGSKLDEALNTRREREAEQKKDEAASPEALRLKSLEKELERIKQESAKSKAEAEAERAKSRDTKLRQQVTEALSSAGVPSHAIKHALASIVDGDKRVRYADDGETLAFREDSGDVDFKAGLTSWLKSDDAKIFLPPRGSVGSGDRGGGSAQRKPGEQPASNEGIGALMHAMLNGQAAR